MAVRFGAAPWVITAILGSYSLCQFIAAPVWGRLSDRYGRRPILIVSMAGACVSYLVLGFAPGLSWLLVSRMLSGFMAGNISAAMAYAADVSLPEQRARALGTVGAAIAVGFMIGPALGGVLVGNNVHTASFLLPALVSAGLSIVAMLRATVSRNGWQVARTPCPRPRCVRWPHARRCAGWCWPECSSLSRNRRLNRSLHCGACSVLASGHAPSA
jgi:MFS family permease